MDAITLDLLSAIFGYSILALDIVLFSWKSKNSKILRYNKSFNAEITGPKEFKNPALVSKLLEPGKFRTRSFKLKFWVKTLLIILNVIFLGIAYDLANASFLLRF